MATVNAIRRRVTYKDVMWRHLADYKTSVLGIAQNGIWRKNQKEYAHILPFEHQRLNILEPYRDEFWEYLRTANIKLHSDFHHLSSSQAMCFNLFFPFIAENNRHLQLLRGIFAADGAIENARFEVVIDTIEGTNFDFCFQTTRSRKLFELKLTENSFGAAPGDDSHIQKYERVYAPAIQGKFAPEFCSCDRFLQHYQIARNVWNLGVATQDSLIFMVPRGNERLKDETTIIDKCLSEQFRDRVTVCYLEAVTAKIEQTFPTDDTRLREHFRQFRQKYLLNKAIPS